MSEPQKPGPAPMARPFSLSRLQWLDVFLGRIDLIAIVVTLVGVGILALLAATAAAIQLARMIAGLWAHPVERWLIVVLALALVWLLARGRKLCVV